MSSTRFSFRAYLLSLATNLTVKAKQKYAIHDYTKLTSGRDYVFELDNNGISAQMTSQRRGVKRGDLIILPSGNKSIQYQILEIDYYSEPVDMWTALLKPQQSHF